MSYRELMSGNGANVKIVLIVSPINISNSNKTSKEYTRKMLKQHICTNISPKHYILFTGKISGKYSFVYVFPKESFGKLLFWVWFDLVLKHINHCTLFSTKSSLYLYIKYIWFGLVGFYGISTIVGYLMPNPLYIYISNIYDLVWLGFMAYQPL